MNTLRGLGSFKKPGDAEPKDFVSVDLTEKVGKIVNAPGTKQPLKKQGHHIIPIVVKKKVVN